MVDVLKMERDSISPLLIWYVAEKTPSKQHTCATDAAAEPAVKKASPHVCFARHMAPDILVLGCRLEGSRDEKSFLDYCEEPEKY